VIEVPADVWNPNNIEFGKYRSSSSGQLGTKWTVQE